MDINNELEKKIISLALEEDEVENDVTTNSLYKFDSIISAYVIAKEDGVISGTNIFRSTFQTIDKSIEIKILKNDGSKICNGDVVIEILGLKTSILKGERTALNFLQRLSGIATLTKRFTDLIKDSKIKLLDTRKTTPGMRYLEKKAVRDGGGKNHRMNLKEMAMIKDNHIKMAGSISNAVEMVRKNTENIRIEVEVTSIAELKEALSKNVDIIMLDNFDENLIKEAVRLKNSIVKYEISGNVTLGNIRSKLHNGIDFISSGALTHSFRSLDLSLEISEESNGDQQ